MSLNSMMPPSKHALMPTLNTEDEAGEFLQNISAIARLPANHKAYLMAIVHDTMSEKPRTMKEMAKDIGCSERTLCFAQANPTFNMALGLVMVGISRGRTHIYVEAMHKLAMKGQFQAVKFMLEYGGTYVKKQEVTSKNLNVMLQQEDSTPESFNDAVDKFLTRMGERSWSAERIVTRFNQLATEGAW